MPEEIRPFRVIDPRYNIEPIERAHIARRVFRFISRRRQILPLRRDRVVRAALIFRAGAKRKAALGRTCPRTV
jgi:hypothetical protein